MCAYAVVAVVRGVEQPATRPVAVPAGTQARPYLSLPLAPGVTVQKVGLGDLDGNGRYDFVLKTPNQNVDPYVNYWKKKPRHLSPRSAHR